MTQLATRRQIAAGLMMAALLSTSLAWGARAFITVGTGDVSGVYYQAGGAICSLVNAGRGDHQIRCTVSSSPGSVDNIASLRRGERALGLAQSDLVQQAYRGSGVFGDRDEFRGLRTVLALHPETVTIVARGATNIGTVQDLRGKRVNVGPQGSGPAASMQALMNALGWTNADFSNALRMSTSRQVEALCEGDLDAAVFITGHPNSAVQEALACGGRLVPIQGPAINRLVRTADYYGTTVVPASAYTAVSDDVATYGVTSLLLSSTNTPRETVFEVTKAVFDNLDDLRGWHSALANLEPAGMARGTGIVEAPLHPGAEMYYEDNDLL